jgi:MerR family mercuric resistance operon transcriptional regulator
MALTIGKVAKAANVHVETLRYYERRGLVAKPPRSLSLYRRYPENTVRRVRFVRHAQALGFSLREIRELLSFRVAPNARCADVKRRADIKLREHREEDPRTSGDASSVETVGFDVLRKTL